MVRTEELEAFVRELADTDQDLDFWKDAAQALVARLDADPD